MGQSDKVAKESNASWPTEYVSELDDMPELVAEMISYYQSLVGILDG